MASENEKYETLADIVAEMRRGTKLPGYWRSCDLNKILKYHADRIEATWKREMTEAEANALAVGGLVESERQRVVVSKTETTTVGNAAAMRAALEKIKALLGECYNGELYEKADEAIAVADSALSAPARNCDKFVTQPEMSRAYEEYRKSAMKNYWNGLTGRVPTVKQKPMTYDEWLLAPAAELKKEGKGDGAR